MNYNVYTVPDQEEITCSIGDAMVHSTDVSSIIEDTYFETIINDIDRENLIQMASELIYDSAKIIMSGNDILGGDIFDGLTGKNQEKKEIHFGSRYTKYDKPKFD